MFLVSIHCPMIKCLILKAGLGISVEEELALKWLEFAQAGLPVAFLSSFVGPFRLNSVELSRMERHYIPWAIQCGSASTFLLNVYYEHYFEMNLHKLQRLVNISPAVTNK
jgi:ubiquinone biosynthesis protein COQ4